MLELLFFTFLAGFHGLHIFWLQSFKNLVDWFLERRLGAFLAFFDHFVHSRLRGSCFSFFH